MGLSKTSSCFKVSLIILSLGITVKKVPSVHVLGDFNFREIVWPARLSKSGSMSQSEGQMLLDIMDDYGLEQMIAFPTRDKNTLDLILTKSISGCSLSRQT